MPIKMFDLPPPPPARLLIDYRTLCHHGSVMAVLGAVTLDIPAAGSRCHAEKIIPIRIYTCRVYHVFIPRPKTKDLAETQEVIELPSGLLITKDCTLILVRWDL